MCYIVYGDHAYFVDDAATKQHITRLRLGDPMLHSEFLVAKPARANRYARNINKASSATEWEEFGNNISSYVSPSHFWARELHETRYKLHSQGIVPRVLLNGLGIPKALQYKNCTIHKRQDCTDVCDVLAQLYNEHFGREAVGGLVYRGESLAAFTAMAFDDMCKPPKRLTLQTEARDKIMAGLGDDVLSAEVLHRRSITLFPEGPLVRMTWRTWPQSAEPATNRRPASTIRGLA